MTDNTENIIVPKWFNVVAIIALVWNLLGVSAFIGQVFITPETIATLPVEEQALYQNIPMWVTIAFACAVFGGSLGALSLVLKKAIALPIFIVSLVGVLVQMYHSFFTANSIEVYGPGGMIMPIMVIVLAFYLVWLANKAKIEKWLN